MSRPGRALELAIKSKHDKYGALCRDSGHDLEVYAMEHFGRMSKDLLQLIERCFNNVDNMWKNDPRWNWTAPTRKTFWIQVISCTLQRSLGIKEAELIKAASQGSPRDLQGTELDVYEWYNTWYDTWDWAPFGPMDCVIENDQ